MSDDFFGKDEAVDDVKDEVKDEVKDDKPTKIKLGEDEYDQDELSSLVKLGKIGREAEEKYQTKLDRVWPEYTKTRQELKEIREKAEADEKAKIDQKAEAGSELTPEEQRKQASSLLKDMGFIHKDDFDQQYSIRREAERVLETCKDLEGEINGKDGRPAFKTREILDYMHEQGFKVPEKAYKDKYETEIGRWQEEQIKKAKPKGLTTEESSDAGGDKQPEIKLPTGEDGLRKMIEESLYGNK